jgi:hypothetical protein
MPDINYWLGVKYGLQQQQANADMIRANAQANSFNAGAGLDTVRAGLLPGQTAADIAFENARKAQAEADAAATRENTKYVGPLATATIGRTNAEAFNARQQGGLYGAQTTGESLLNRLFNFYRLSDNKPGL